MSYDLPDDYVPPPKPPFSFKSWMFGKWIDFVIWCAFDAKSKRLNDWGIIQLTSKEKKR